MLQQETLARCVCVGLASRAIVPIGPIIRAELTDAPKFIPSEPAINPSQFDHDTTVLSRSAGISQARFTQEHTVGARLRRSLPWTKVRALTASHLRVPIQIEHHLHPGSATSVSPPDWELLPLDVDSATSCELSDFLASHEVLQMSPSTDQ